MPKSGTNPQVDVYLRGAKTWRNEMEKLRSIALDCELTEELKWGKPCYMFGESNVVIVQAFKANCALLFCKGALLKDPKRILKKPGENTQAARRVEFTSVSEISNLAATLKAYLKEAIAAEKAGLEVTYKKPTDFKMPEELQKKLARDLALKKAFAALTPGRQRSHFLYISTAKQSATREARVEKCIPKILGGKGFLDR